MALATIPQDGGLSDIQTLLNLVKNQNTTSTSSTAISDAGLQAQLNEILGSNQGLAAVAGAQHSAGFYNSTVNTQMVNDLLTRAAAQVQAKAATTTQTTSKQAPLSKTNALLTLGSLALKNSSTAKAAYQKLTGMFSNSAPVMDNSYDPISEALTPGTMPTIDAGSSVGDTIGSIPTLSDASTAADVGSTADNLAALTSGSDTADVGSALVSTAANADGVDAASLTALDNVAAGSADASAGTSAALDGIAADNTLAGAGAGSSGLSGTAATGWGALAVASAIDANATENSGDSNAKNFLDYTGDIGTSDVIRGLDSGNVMDSVNPLGQGLLGAVGVPKSGGWIICTELVRQNRMPRKYYASGLKVFQSYRLDLLDGYYIWAIPAVKLLQTKPFCIRSKLLSWMFNHRAEYLASCSGVGTARNTVTGQVISCTVYGFCFILGLIIKTTRKQQKEFSHG